ncbi:MAG: PDZ domain-containing protein [Nannocystaceae bacterium]
MPAFRLDLIIAVVLAAVAVMMPPSAAAAAAKSTAPGVAYHVSISRPETQYVDIEMKVPAMRGRRIELAMPAWIPGSYLIRDFGRHVYAVAATDVKNTTLAVRRVDKQTWSVHTSGRAFTRRYRVFADDLSVRSSYVDSRFALLNGTSIFMYIKERAGRASTLSLSLPDGWGIHTALARHGSLFRAPSYDALVDAPLLLGKADTRRYQVDGTRFRYVLLAPAGTNADIDRLTADSHRFVRSFGELLGGFPFQAYTFLVVADPRRGGGLEHHNSTAMIVRPWAFTNNEAYTKAAGLGAHEFFHAWNVKRIHDRVLGPFDYSRENYTELLWFHEGFTSAMSQRALLHAGLIDADEYLSNLEDTWHRFLRKPGRNYTPLRQLSRDAWFKAYKRSANHANTVVSYYQKGELVGAMLDLELHLRSASHGQQGSLAGLFKRLWQERRPGDSERVITARDIVTAARREAGEEMAWFFDRFVSGTEELTLPDSLLRVGVGVRADEPWVVDNDTSDEEKFAAPRERAWSGIVGKGDEITNIVPGSPAERSAMMRDDEVLAIDGMRTRSWSEAASRLSERAPGDTVTIAFFRHGSLEARRLTLAPNPYQSWTFELAERGSSNSKGQDLLDRWLYRYSPRSSARSTTGPTARASGFAPGPR